MWKQHVHRFSVNANEFEYRNIDESENVYKSGKISSSVNLVSVMQ